MALIIQAIKVAICWFALLQLGVVLGDASKTDRKQDLCDNKHLKLRSYTDIKRTITEGCTPEVETAFKEFDDSVLNQIYDACTMEKVTNLTSFIGTHLRNKPIGKANDDGLPLEFANYAIAYGMELASSCKRILLDSFYRHVKWATTIGDVEAVDEWIKDDGPIARLLDPISKQATFPLPSDFIDLLPEFKDSYKAALKLTDGNKYNRAKAMCEKRFRPFYEPAILPIAHLARHGFTYNAPDLARDLLLSSKPQSRYAFWSRIVFLCESLKHIQIIEGPAVCPPVIDVVLADDADWQTTAPELRPLTEWERPKVVFRGPQKLGSIFSLRLQSSVDNYKLSLSSTDRFKRRLLKNKGRLLLAAFKSKETTGSLLKRAFEIASRRINGKEAEELESTKKNLMSLLDSDKKSKFVKVLNELGSASAWVLRKFAMLLEFILLFALAIISIPTGCCRCRSDGGECKSNGGCSTDAFVCGCFCAEMCN